MEDIFVILQLVFICKTEVSKVFSASGSVHAGVEVCRYVGLFKVCLAHATVKPRGCIEQCWKWSVEGATQAFFIPGPCRVCIASSVCTGPWPRKTGVWVGKNHKDIASRS